MKLIPSKQFKFAICLIFLITFISSCANQNYSNTEVPVRQEKNNIPIVKTEIDSTLLLKFTTGIRAILEDSNGNIWFGDRDTGAWKYDGKSMKNYTKEDGLTTTHIWQIYNSKNGELWFAMDDGIVLKFNGKAFERIF